ncbi:DNA alkylation repair protein [Leucobacter insecticola]|uniref:DNA alkylation repair protein n=1 Tax=Leucobacter insecticola TaxID=2714934 RepID=A0A6G8FIQ4_9MICO|nr:DNA alkylation repair protein [Leucobacter insecticola]QIM16330.1 DNA alkylation repair protein [Leucobacter insecticola]
MPLADELLGQNGAIALVEILERADHHTSFAHARLVAAEIDSLTLSERARAIARGILADIDGDRDRLSRVIRNALEDETFAGFTLWPLGLAASWSAIEAGTDQAFDNGMELMRELTPRMSSEFSVRPLLLHNLSRGLRHMTEWTGDPDWNVRRLASEGSRPLLPWGERLPVLVTDPSPTLPILNALYDDPEESVRRSVANHLNDHSRTHPELTVLTVRGWQRSGGEHVARTSRHALRTLVKRGDPGALELLGFPPVSVTVSPLTLSTKRVPAGGAVQFSAEVQNTGDEPARMVIDYVLSFPGARGGTRSKVFKIAERALDPGDGTVVTASHSFRPITTRKYYPGSYALALQINGVTQEPAEFTVEEN